MQTFNEWVQAQGFNPESLSEQQRLVLKAAWRASQAEPTLTAVRPDGTPVATPTQSARSAPAVNSDGGTATGNQASCGAEELMEQMLARTRAENTRQQDIAALVSRYLEANPGQIAIIEAIGKAAIQSKWTLQETELRMMRDVRSNGPIVYAPTQPNVTADVVEAALCRTGGLKQERLEAEFKPQTLEAADKHFRRGIGLQEVINLAARSNGMRNPDARRDTRATLKAAFRESDGGDHMPRADVGPSTISISGILSNVANKYLREAFSFVESSWRSITATRPVSDFKEITGYSLTGDLTYEKVAPGGEIKHGTLGEETYGNKADTYGKLIGIDRRDIINDDLGAITQVSKRLGRGGALKVNDVFWTAFMNNSTFFTTGNSNYDDGTDTAFGADGLFAADVFWKAMTDPNGKPMGHTAKILLVPSNHYLSALRITKSQRQNKDSLDGEDNVFAGLYQVVTSSYLNNSSFTGYSTKAWYLLCDPNDVPVIETVFLNGQEMPTIETAEMDFDRLGIALRGFHDFGVRLQEPRGGFKFKGEA